MYPNRILGSTLLPFFFRVPLLKPNSREKGARIIKGLLGNLQVGYALARQ